jgi:hypothetical protein
MDKLLIHKRESDKTTEPFEIDSPVSLKAVHNK